MQCSLTAWAPMASEGINEATHSYKPGDIISCDPFVDDVSTHPRFILFNITDMPDNSIYEYQLRHMKRIFESGYSLGVEPVQVRRRAWRINFGLMPANMQQNLRETRGITLPWRREDGTRLAAGYISMRDVIDENDFTRDGDLFLQDGDL